MYIYNINNIFLAVAINKINIYIIYIYFLKISTSGFKGLKFKFLIIVIILKN